jgi:phage baseplate assembly protein gpV
MNEALLERMLAEGGQDLNNPDRQVPGGPNPDEPRKYYGVTVGRVINPADPLTLGRLQVQLPFIDSLDLAPWARVATPMAGQLSGFYCLPKIGDEVLVAFEHGDVNVPYIIGGLWNAFSPPPLPSPIPQIRCIRTLVGNQIVFMEAPPTLILQNGPTPPEPIPAPTVPGAYQSLMLAPTGMMATATIFQVQADATVQLMVGSNMVTIDASGVSITSTGEVNINAAAGINITAGGTLTITAPMVNIN